ncbi:MAG: hypothetical protein ACR2QZ_09345, partial [Woeseiaceae bacterium]
LNQRKFFFGRDVIFVEGNEEALSEYAAKLATLQADAADFGFTVSVLLKGSADTTGNSAANVRLADQRAAAVATGLALMGVQARVVSQTIDAFADAAPKEDIGRRFVEVNLQTQSTRSLP